MAKFAVGEKAIAIKLGVVVTVIGPAKNPMAGDYTIAGPGINPPCDGAFSHQLRKLPPDDRADDTTEDPGLTRIKKLLEQDQTAHKQPTRVKA